MYNSKCIMTIAWARVRVQGTNSLHRACTCSIVFRYSSCAPLGHAGQRRDAVSELLRAEVVRRETRSQERARITTLILSTETEEHIEPLLGVKHA